MALDGNRWPASQPGHFRPMETASGTHWMGGWVGPTVGIGILEKRKIALSGKSQSTIPWLSSPLPVRTTLKSSLHLVTQQLFQQLTSIWTLAYISDAQILGVMSSRRQNFTCLAPNICGSSAGNLLHVTPLVPRILKCHLAFLKICALLIYIIPMNINFPKI